MKLVAHCDKNVFSQDRLGVFKGRSILTPIRFQWILRAKSDRVIHRIMDAEFYFTLITYI